MIVVDREKCIGCGLCVSDCLGKAISLESGRAEIIKGCFMCGHCVAVCPENCFSFQGEKYGENDVEDIGGGFGIGPETMLHAIKSRRSIRQYKKEALSKKELELILEAGRFSPTASNTQNVRYIVFSEETEQLRALAMEEMRRCEHDEEAFNKVFPPPFSRSRIDFSNDDFLFKGAPNVVVVVCPHQVNAAIASANMELMAASMGLGMLYVGFFVRLAAQSQKLRDFMGLDAEDYVATCLCFGRPDVKYQRSVPRKKLNANWR